MEQFTEQERDLLMELLSNLKVNPLDTGAAESVALIQSIAAKVQNLTEVK